jgi:hypothetical protein
LYKEPDAIGKDDGEAPDEPTEKTPVGKSRTPKRDRTAKEI